MKTTYVKRKDYWKYFLQLSDFRGIFYASKNLSDEEKKNLFLKLIFVVNMELSTYCNRKCSYCPLGLYPPPPSRYKKYMSDVLFKSIIQQLHQMNYSSYVMLNFYNEPLLDTSLSTKISYVREMLPNAWILFNSNGDFLNTERLNKLYAAGLNQIIVTLHTSPNQPYEDSDRRNSVEKFLKKLKLETYFDQRIENPNRNIMLDIAISETEKIFVATNNWQVYGNDRGGTLKNLSSSQRTAPCVNPFREICIAYDGTIKPCCNIYFNCPDIYGNANKNLLTDIYFSDELCKFRKELFVFSRKSGGCATCNTEDNAQIEEQSERKNILSRCSLG